MEFYHSILLVNNELFSYQISHLLFQQLSYILVKHYQSCSPNCYSFAVRMYILVSFLFLFYLNAGEAKKLAVTKVVTLRDFEQTDPSPPPEKWVKCFRVNDSLQELSTNIMKDWEFPNTSHVLLHIDVPNQQLYHLPLLITPVHCVYLVTFDLREEKKAFKRIHEAMKHISAFVSYSSSKSLLENYSPPKVLLVGTHKKGITDDQKIIFVQRLREILKKYRGLILKPGDEEFWAVEGDDIDIQNTNIFKEIELPSCQPQVPTCRCIEYCNELDQKFPEKTVLLPHVLKTVVLPRVSSAEVKKFLAFLHDYGFIVYHPYQEPLDDDTPVIQPQYLCELFATAQELRKKWDGEVTVEGLFSSNAKLERSMKKWFEMFCIRMGLVIEQPMGDGRSLVFVLSRQLRSETASLASHVYSVDPLLVTYKHRAKDIDCYIPPRFFPAFASAFLKILNGHEECKDRLTVSIDQSPARIVVDWEVGCHVHVLEQESCIEIGFQLDAVNWNEHKTQPKFKKLQKRCQIVKTVVRQSAEDAVTKLNMPGGDACVEYGFYHVCDGATVIGVRVSDEDETALRCCCPCRGTPCTPMQDIWFQDVMDCKVCSVSSVVCLCILLRTVIILLLPGAPSTS